MNLVVLHLADCPRWRTALARVHAASRNFGVDPHTITHTSVSTEEAPRTHGFLALQAGRTLRTATEPDIVRTILEVTGLFDTLHLDGQAPS